MPLKEKEIKEVQRRKKEKEKNRIFHSWVIIFLAKRPRQNLLIMPGAPETLQAPNFNFYPLHVYFT
jgi:hypothetical protein